MPWLSHPVVLDLAPGRYRWCACGRSHALPLCDGSDACSGQPVTFEVPARVGYQWLCACGQTGRPPFCDGRHNRVVKR